MTAPSVCPDCGTGLVERDQFCSGCGRGVVRCIDCGGVGMAGDKYCAHCGSNLPTDDEGGIPAVKVTAPRAAASPWAGILQRLKAATDGEYEIIREIGRGGMAAVFLARELALNRSVAIKVMSPGVMMSDGMIERFHQEAVTVANLNHSNIVTVHTVRELDDLHFFVMEFVAGRALDRVIADRGQLPIPVVRAIASQVGSALAYAHRRGVIHRDIKPGNIILDSDGQAIVTDFGIAKVMTATSQTATGAVHGTAAYMSPEQCYAALLTSASDQYSLGVVAYEMLAGKPPYTGDSPFALMQAHTTAEVPRLAPHRPDCPPDLEEAVLRMLAKKPNDRWPNMNAALNGLRAFPVAPDDPVLAELLELANEGTAGDDGEIRTPLSPIPSVPRRTPNRSATPPKSFDKVVGPLTPASAAAAKTITADPPSSPVPASEPAIRSASPVITPIREAVAPSREAAVALPPAVVTPASVDVAPRTRELAPASPAVTHRRFPMRLVLGGAGIVALLGAGIYAFGGDSGGQQEKSSDPPVTRTPRTVVLSDPPVVVRVGDTVAFQARVRGGDSLSAVPTRWVSLTPAARVDESSGEVTSIAPGQAMIVATNGDAQDTASFEILPALAIGPDPASIASLEIQLPAGGTSLDVGQRIAARVRAFNAAQTAVSTAGRVSWVSSNAAIATVDNEGRITGVSPGDVRISVQSATRRSAYVALVVRAVVRDVVISGPDQLEAGQSSQLSAIARDAQNRAVAGASVSWSSANRAIMQVDPSTGQIRAGDAGQAVITASAGSVNATKVIVVTKKPEIRVAEEVAPPKSKEPSAEELMRSNEARIKAAVESYARDLGARNLARVASLYNPVTDQDRKNLDALTDLLRANSLTVTQSAVGVPRLESRQVHVNLSTTLRWRNFAGANVERQVPFLAVFELSGSEWRLVTCRIVGSPRLT